MGNKYKKFAAARADMLPIKVQILNYFTNFKDKSTDRMPNVVVDLPDLRESKYFSHSVGGAYTAFFKAFVSSKSHGENAKTFLKSLGYSQINFC